MFGSPGSLGCTVLYLLEGPLVHIKAMIVPEQTFQTVVTMYQVLAA